MPRKFHKKSKDGCDQCKARRVKCDEGRPQCTICTDRELPCTYTKAGVSRQTQANPLTKSGPKQRERERNTSVSTQYELRHLQLMHKFATDTYKSLCGNESDMEHWQLLVPRLAYSHEFLLNGVFALAALHLTATTPDPTQALSYLSTALQCNEISLAPFREALNNLSPVNCVAVFAQSAIVTVIGISLPRLNSQYRGEEVSMVETMITVVELVQGANQISQLSSLWRQESVFCKYDFWRMDKAELDEDTAHAIEKLRILNRSIYMADEAQYASNHDAIELLQGCFARFAYAPHPAPILAWPAYGKRGFVDGLGSRQPFPLLVLMHWGVLLNELSPLFWWAEECGKALVAEMLQELKGDNEEWNLALQWPQSKVGLGVRKVTL